MHMRFALYPGSQGPSTPFFHGHGHVTVNLSTVRVGHFKTDIHTMHKMLTVVSEQHVFNNVAVACHIEASAPTSVALSDVVEG